MSKIIPLHAENCWWEGPESMTFLIIPKYTNRLAWASMCGVSLYLWLGLAALATSSKMALIWSLKTTKEIILWLINSRWRTARQCKQNELSFKYVLSNDSNMSIAKHSIPGISTQYWYHYLSIENQSSLRLYVRFSFDLFHVVYHYHQHSESLLSNKYLAPISCWQHLHW